MKALNLSLEQIDKNLDSIEDDIKTAKKERRHKVVAVVTDVVSLMFTAGTLVASFGTGTTFAALAKAATITVKIGLAAGAAAATFKGIIDSMSIDDRSQLISELREQAKELPASKDKFVAVEFIFEDVFQNVNVLDDSLNQMSNALMNIKRDVTLSDLNLTALDAEAIGDEWDKVHQATTIWLDTINAEGIIV